MLTLAREPFDSADARDLVTQLDEELHRRYPGSSVHGVRAGELDAPGSAFVVARHDGRAVGCGALRALAPAIAEVKRMFVDPAVRRGGVGRAILRALEDIARELGHGTLRVETGTRQPEAIALYRGAGYEPIAAFGEYVGDPFSVCFEKRLG